MNQKKRILVTGANGLVGRSLMVGLQAEGHEVRTLSRSSGDYLWDVEAGEMDANVLKGVDSVVHLAGESIAQRWTRASQEHIRRSRIESTRLLVEGILAEDRPIDFICASGVNYYGHQSGEGQTEQSNAGAGFLAKVCQEWEAAHQPLSEAGQRSVSLRIGVVLSPEGGAVKRLLPIFRAGLGGPAGPGDQLMSWIGLPDLVAIIIYLIAHREISGPVNAVCLLIPQRTQTFPVHWGEPYDVRLFFQSPVLCSVYSTAIWLTKPFFLMSVRFPQSCCNLAFHSKVLRSKRLSFNPSVKNEHTRNRRTHYRCRHLRIALRHRTSAAGLFRMPPRQRSRCRWAYVNPAYAGRTH